MESETTIVAPATPPGHSAVALIRLSGPEAVEICSKVFAPAAKGKKLLHQKPNTVHFGRVCDGEDIIDEVLVTIFRSPHSYTGEDVAEVSCHGSPYVRQRVLQLFIDRGAVMARPGEFTKRAFLNGKMDLMQAEAVADLIQSSSGAFHDVAINHMRGGFSAGIKELRSKLLEFSSLIELELDFSEEDVEFADRRKLMSLLTEISERLESLTGSFSFGNALRNGLPVVIAGKPNTGKSTLLNALLEEEKALVSEIPGTTRDSIEDIIHLEGIAFRFIDTAGIRETTEKIEVMGIKRTMEKIRTASVILLMVEATDTHEHIDHLVRGLREKPEFRNRRMILLINKSDLGTADYASAGKDNFPSLGEKDRLAVISAKKGSGLDRLKELLVEMVQKDRPGEGDVVVTNARHYEALKKAHESVIRAGEGLENGLPADLVAMDIRDVLHHLGEISGDITTEEILGNIFKNFCIGK